MRKSLLLLVVVHCFITRSPAIALVTTTPAKSMRTISHSLFAGSENVADTSLQGNDDEPSDTIRVRLWQALANGDELSLQALGAAVGERRQGELRSHLQHVETQAKTFRNKSSDWKERRGLDSAVIKKVKLLKRTDKKKNVYYKLKF